MIRLRHFDSKDSYWFGYPPRNMTHVVTSACVNHKYQDCVAVCPVEAFRELPTYLVIDPDECIDCGVCEPECPIDAIHSDTEENMEKWVEINRIYSEKWPMINQKKEPPSDSKDWENIENKFEKYFSKKPGK